MMQDEKDFAKLDALLGGWFTRPDAGGAGLGFESRVMLAVERLRSRQELSVWDVLGLSARPWLAAGLAAAALLAVVVFQADGQSSAGYLTTALDGPLVAHWLAL